MVISLCKDIRFAYPQSHLRASHRPCCEHLNQHHTAPASPAPRAAKGEYFKLLFHCSQFICFHGFTYMTPAGGGVNRSPQILVHGIHVDMLFQQKLDDTNISIGGSYVQLDN